MSPLAAIGHKQNWNAALQVLPHPLDDRWPENIGQRPVKNEQVKDCSPQIGQ